MQLTVNVNGRALRWFLAGALIGYGLTTPFRGNAASTVTLPHIFANGDPADANEVNENFDALAQAIMASDNRLASTESKVGDLAQLTTVDNGSLVGAINETFADLQSHAHDAADVTTGKLSNDRLNLGAGGGIDADLLDGLHATAFAPSTHGHAAGGITYSNLSSGLSATDVQAALDEIAAGGGSGAGAGFAADVTTVESSLFLPFQQSTGEVVLQLGHVYRFPSFLQSGGTIRVTGTGGLPLVLVSDGDIVINGTIDMRGADAAGRFGGGGAGFAGGSVTGQDSDQRGGDYFSPQTPFFGGGGGDAFGNTAFIIQPYVTTVGTPHEPRDLRTLFNITAGPGGGSGDRASSGSGGGGGGGGGLLVLVAQGDITVGGTIDLSGGNGVQDPSNTGTRGGGGGGGAGGVLVAAHGGLLTITGAVDVAGGFGALPSGGPILDGGGGGSGASGAGTEGSRGVGISFVGGGGGDGGPGVLLDVQL